MIPTVFVIEAVNHIFHGQAFENETQNVYLFSRPLCNRFGFQQYITWTNWAEKRRYRLTKGI
jgi:hypothetical protein